MPIKVLSTYKILKNKAFNNDIDESWVDWAIEMIEAGYESDNLYELAGKTKPYNQFELQVLTDKVLTDLELDYKDKESTISNYVYFLISIYIDKPDNYHKLLRELMLICIDLDMDENYNDFYLLYFAKDDLIYSENQWYWQGADRSNIDSIIRVQLQDYMTKFEKR